MRWSFGLLMKLKKKYPPNQVKITMSQNEKITSLKLEIDHIKEYLETDACKRCDEMNSMLDKCEQLLKEIIELNKDLYAN